MKRLFIFLSLLASSPMLGKYRLIKLSKLMASPVWDIAKQSVQEVIKMAGIQAISTTVPRISFCPYCGQIPTGDRRMDEARSLAMGKLGSSVKQNDLDFALAWHYFMAKGAK